MIAVEKVSCVYLRSGEAEVWCGIQVPSVRQTSCPTAPTRWSGDAFRDSRRPCLGSKQRQSVALISFPPRGWGKKWSTLVSFCMCSSPSVTETGVSVGPFKKSFPDEFEPSRFFSAAETTNRVCAPTCVKTMLVLSVSPSRPREGKTKTKS